jgi:FAS-associated factor 2
MADVDVDQLSSTQQEALQQYVAVTDQDIKDAVPLLERSQWNVQVSLIAVLLSRDKRPS